MLIAKAVLGRHAYSRLARSKVTYVGNESEIDVLIKIYKIITLAI